VWKKTKLGEAGHMHPKKTKGLSLGFGFQFFGEFEWISCKFQIRSFKILKKFSFWLWIWVYILKIRKKIKIDTLIHTQKGGA